MANKADPINHDLLSSTATAGLSAVKWSAIGALAIPLVGAAIMGAIGAAVVGGFGVVALGAALVGGIATLAAEAVLAPTLLGGMAIGGGLLGIAKGGQRVSAENQAFRDRAMGNAHSRQLKTAKLQNDGEIKGIQEGYQIGRADGEQVGFQKGQEFVVQQIMQHQLAEQQAAAAAAQQPVGKHTAALAASCKCESKVEMVDKQRAEAAAVANQIH